VSWADFLATLVDVAGGKAPRNIDGRSFLPVLLGKKSKHRSEVFTTHAGDGNWNIYPMRAVRVGNWKYIRNLHPEFAFTTHIDLAGNLGQRAYFASWEAAAKTNAQAAAIVKRYHSRPTEELYDLSADPHEQKNLAGDPRLARRLKSLSRELDAWMKKQGDAQKVYGSPRLLSDPNSFGANAPTGDKWK
jgi:arylsulfatase A-like enzyme